MNRTDISGFAVKAFVAMAALSAVHGTSIAQEAGAEPESDIVVEAPRPVPVPTPVPNPPVPDGEKSPYSGAPVIVTTVRLPVLYSDLNLKNPADAERLRSVDDFHGLARPGLGRAQVGYFRFANTVAEPVTIE